MDLQQANLALQQNHEKLLASEKMAALGSLVAGVAHELNTPIGNGLVTATTLRDHTRSLLDQFQQGLTRSALKDYLDEATLAADILERNLHRASNLIQSFKPVSYTHLDVYKRQALGPAALATLTGPMSTGVTAVACGLAPGWLVPLRLPNAMVWNVFLSVLLSKLFIIVTFSRVTLAPFLMGDVLTAAQVSPCLLYTSRCV